ncbi:hypothetical protein ACZ87_02170 [Candidatus Erwinia dacicola]|uniref:Uncharacterized protein n=1 Tax=Candidatus Erwinia dacicola TaxID=252393 RepID=A0A328TQ15_9GAMM|nr:hypothetical protein ACZ87_02170 [Candidatus Erwinia dacicola]
MEREVINENLACIKWRGFGCGNYRVCKSKDMPPPTLGLQVKGQQGVIRTLPPDSVLDRDVVGCTV